MAIYQLEDRCEKITIRVRRLPNETKEDAEMRAAAKLNRKLGHTYVCNGGWWYRQRVKNGYFETEASACFGRNPLNGEWAE